jgi:hypothetical protein
MTIGLRTQTYDDVTNRTIVSQDGFVNTRESWQRLVLMMGERRGRDGIDRHGEETTA